MSSIFNRLLSFDDTQKRLQQFHEQVENLKQQKETATIGSSVFDAHQFRQRCTDLKRQLDNYTRKIEGMNNVSGPQSKEVVLQDLKALSEELTTLMTPVQIDTTTNAVEMIAPETEREDEEVEIVAENSVQEEENVAEYSAEDSSSDPDYASDRSEPRGQHKTKELEREESEELEGKTIEDKRFTVVADFEAQEKTDLSLKQGEFLRIIATREDGWWLAENSNGDRGFVPKTFLKVYKESKKLGKKETRQIEDKPVPMPRQTTAAKVQDASSSGLVRTTNFERQKPRKPEQESTRDFREQREENVAMIKDITPAPAERSNGRPYGETKILEESRSEESNSGSNEENALPETIQAPPRAPITRPIAVQPEAPTVTSDYESHLTYQCYLAPRLSESNYAFHDIYWNYEDDRLRKRRVRVSKLIRIVRLEKIYLNLTDVHCRLVRAYLFDRNAAEDERQIVSNVYTIKANPRARDPQTWIFAATNDPQKATLDYPSFIVRSNYKQKNVVLCLEAVIITNDQEGEITERSLGCITLPIINESGHCCMQNKNHVLKLVTRDSLGPKGSVPVNTHIQITFRVSNVPDNIVYQADSLPDIILCNSLYVPMFFYYRRLLGQFLTKDGDSCNNAVLRPEPFLATFPAVADQPDLMDMLWKLWQIHQKNVASKKLPELEEADRYRSFFMITGFILYQTIVMPEFKWTDVRGMADRQAVISNFREQYLHNFDVVKYLSRQRCRPINVFSYAVDIAGPHAVS